MIILVIVLILGALYWTCMSPYSQLWGLVPWRGRTNQKVVALTFDDGPNEPYTSDIVAFLNKHKISATFFQVGTAVQRYPNVTRAMAQAGHIIGNHSLSHAFTKYFTQPSFRHEIAENQRVLTEVLGKTPALYRSPWLWRQPWLLHTVKQLKLHPVWGEFGDALEVLRPGAEHIARRTLAKVRPGSIIIFHDGIDGKGGDRQQTIEAAKIVVKQLQANGYAFVTVDKLLNLPAYQ